MVAVSEHKLFWFADKNWDVTMLVVADTVDEAKKIVEEYLKEKGWTVERFFEGEPDTLEEDLKEKGVLCINTGVEW